MADRPPVDVTVLGAETPPDPAEPHLVLWNTARFFDLRPGQLAGRRRLDHTDAEGRLVGSLVVGIDGDPASDGGTVAISGMGAPFGGFDVARKGETVANIEALLADARRQLAAQGVTELVVRAKPAHYGVDEAALAFVLTNQGFMPIACDLNAYLDLTSLASVDEYVAGLKPAARKGLRRSVAQGLTAAQLGAGDDAGWVEAHEILRRNRVDRGRPMKLPPEYVTAIRDAFPGRVRMLVVTHGEQMVAAALIYRVARRRDLVQYWGDALHDLPTSPMHLLVAAVVEHALAAGSETVDIGISSEDGIPNHGLIQFKRAVGCTIEPRCVLRGLVAPSGVRDR